MGKAMIIEAQSTASVTAETVEAKARLQLALDRIVELETTLREAKAHFLANQSVAAFIEICAAIAADAEAMEADPRQLSLEGIAPLPSVDAK